MERLDVNKINRLIVEVSLNNERALTKLYNYTYQNVLQFVRYYAYSQNDIEDIISELYYNIFQYSHSFDQCKNGYNWMLQIAKHLCFQFNGKIEAACNLTDDIPDCSNEKYIENLFFKEACQTLTELERQYIELVYRDGYTIKEISKSRNVTVSAIYNSLHNAYKKLKKFYEDV